MRKPSPSLHLQPHFPGEHAITHVIAFRLRHYRRGISDIEYIFQAPGSFHQHQLMNCNESHGSIACSYSLQSCRHAMLPPRATFPPYFLKLWWCWHFENCSQSRNFQNEHSLLNWYSSLRWKASTQPQGLFTIILGLSAQDYSSLIGIIVVPVIPPETLQNDLAIPVIGAQTYHKSKDDEYLEQNSFFEKHSHRLRLNLHGFSAWNF